MLATDGDMKFWNGYRIAFEATFVKEIIYMQVNLTNFINLVK